MTNRVTYQPKGIIRIIRRARLIARTLGYYRAARYLRNRGISCDGARIILLDRC